MTKLSTGIIAGLVTQVVLFCSCSKIVVRQLEPAPPPPAIAKPIAVDGMVYALPRTVVRMQFKMDRISRSGAPFAPYAPIFAPNLKPICKDKDCTKEGKVEYSIEDGATFSTYGEPDPDFIFVVENSAGGAIDQSLTMSWTEGGVLTAASATVTNRTSDIIVSTIGLATGIAAKTAFGGGAQAQAKLTCKDRFPGSQASRGASANDGWFERQIDAISSTIAVAEAKEAILSNYCNLNKEVRDTLLTDESLFTNAAQAYFIQIYPLVKKATGLLNYEGTLYFDPVPLIGQIQTEINTRLIPLFIGTKEGPMAWNATLDIRMVKEYNNGKLPDLPLELPILEVDPLTGVRLVENNAQIPPDGLPMPKEFSQPAKTGSRKTYKFALDYYPASRDQLFTRVADVTSGDRSFRYRLPAQVKARLEEITKQGTDPESVKSCADGKFFMAQYGTILSLPATRHSKSLTYNIGLIESTGGLKTFTLGTTGSLDAASITALGTATGTVLDARNAAAQKAAAAANAVDPALAKQDATIKAQDEICTIQKKYNLPCTIQPQ